MAARGIPPPDTLNLDDLLDTQNSIADIYVFGFQEIVPLSAGNILVPENTSGGKEGDERQRNADAAHILARTLFPAEAQQHLPRKILDHDRVIWLGDLNYRIYLPEATTRYLVKNKEWSILLQNDQLKAELRNGHVFAGWNEKEIEFAPTYKYDQDSDDYYGSNHKIKAKRMRAPAWCDRIIWFGKGLKQTHYNRVESRLSDHRPVRAIFVAYVEVSGPSKEPRSVLSNRFVDSSNYFTSSSND
ncbi:UNVERIFIED_CONTAM: Type IV inositol polyphosphate 5-phosphatase 9 [Sesamum latifolium]|uniref:Type IV inositol polyphosphate 5-phosphatase 9 n=1 Tax=Sesamum latifolium TaxID=2727402 RepID=A0AAW2UFL8_9LAMI